MIDLAKAGGVWTVTLNRPEKANALGEAMLARLADIAEAAAQPGGARAFILTGAGKVFSAGADLDEVRAGGLATSPEWERLSAAIAALPCLSIAALNGTLAGGAMGMALACDLRVAATGAQAFYPVMKLGFLPQPSDPRRLTALIGPARAKLILMAGQRIDSATALQWGLFDRIVAPEALMDEAHALAKDSLSATPEHAAAIKQLIR